MGHITIKREIQAPIETVFAYVDAHKNTIKYMKGLTKWAPTTSVVHGKDAEFEVVMKAGPRDLRSVVRITAWTENRTIAWRSIDGFKQTGKWVFGRRGDHTDAIFDMEYDLGGGFAGRLLGAAVEPVVRHNLEQSVDALKAQTEKLKAPAAKPEAARTATPAKASTARAKATTPAKAGTPAKARTAGTASTAARKPPGSRPKR